MPISSIAEIYLNFVGPPGREILIFQKYGGFNYSSFRLYKGPHFNLE